MSISIFLQCVEIFLHRIEVFLHYVGIFSSVLGFFTTVLGLLLTVLGLLLTVLGLFTSVAPVQPPSLPEQHSPACNSYPDDEGVDRCAAAQISFMQLPVRPDASTAAVAIRQSIKMVEGCHCQGRGAGIFSETPKSTTFPFPAGTYY